MDGHNSALFSKKGDEWETPFSLYSKLDDEFHFQCDAAATLENTKCEWCITDALTLDDWMSGDWIADDGSSGMTKFFLNPPYSKIGAFMKKAYEESLKGAIVVCLIPARTDTKYFHDYCMKAAEIRFIKGRLQFANRTLPSWRADGNFKMSSAPFPSIVVVFDEARCKQNGHIMISEIPWR